jgi:Ca2+-transporting ATPase
MALSIDTAAATPGPTGAAMPAPTGAAARGLAGAEGTGLAGAEAARLLAAEGYNELPAPEARGVLRIVGEVVRQPMFALLIGGGVVYLLLGDRTEAVLLLVFACLSVGITIVQESRSEHVLEALRNLASPRATVLRDGRRVVIAGREVVRGDLLVVGEGDRVAADATLTTSQDLLLDESLLTGESVPVRKEAGTTADGKPASEAVPGGEDTPHIFAGTLVVRGSGIARVHATGAASAMGRIGRALATIETAQPHLQRQIARLVRDFAIVGGIAGCAAVLLYGLLRGSWLEALLSGIALGMSMMPEEFPLVIAVFMAMGAWRISRARVLTRRAAAIETLGATTVLCTDKTGTLTENRMTLVAINDGCVTWRAARGAAPAAAAQETLAVARLACPAVPVDPMDIAVAALAGTSPAPRLVRAWGLRPDLFAVANLHAGDTPGSSVASAKGALEAIAELCNMAPERLAAIRHQADALAGEGIRVLAVASAELPGTPAAADLPETPRGLPFEYAGLIGFADPLRANVPAAVAECRGAGIRVLMITGDYPVTALAIARAAGIDAARVLDGDAIAGLTDEALAARVKDTSVFARIRPEQKLRIVQSLKAGGAVVAMTGDGVNDAPAIKAAHIGIAMGARGTDVAREASAIVLLDDDFGSIVRTIRLGRRIYDNLRKATEYIVAVHIPIAGLALLPLLFGLPLILAPIHIAFLEMVIDPACSVVLEAEEEEEDVMRRPPREPDSRLLPPRRMWWALLQGATVLALVALVMFTAARAKLPEGELRALVFTCLVLVNMGLILVNRSFSASLLAAFRRPNRSLWILLGGVGAVLACAQFWPPARDLFHFGPLHWHDLAIGAGAGVVSLVLLETVKSRWFRGGGAAPAGAGKPAGAPT